MLVRIEGHNASGSPTVMYNDIVLDKRPYSYQEFWRHEGDIRSEQFVDDLRRTAAARQISSLFDRGSFTISHERADERSIAYAIKSGDDVVRETGTLTLEPDGRRLLGRSRIPGGHEFLSVWEREPEQR